MDHVNVGPWTGIFKGLWNKLKAKLFFAVRKKRFHEILDLLSFGKRDG